MTVVTSVHADTTRFTGSQLGRQIFRNFGEFLFASLANFVFFHRTFGSTIFEIVNFNLTAAICYSHSSTDNSLSLLSGPFGSMSDSLSGPIGSMSVEGASDASASSERLF